MGLSFVMLGEGIYDDGGVVKLLRWRYVWFACELHCYTDELNDEEKFWWFSRRLAF